MHCERSSSPNHGVLNAQHASSMWQLDQFNTVSAHLNPLRTPKFRGNFAEFRVAQRTQISQNISRNTALPQLGCQGWAMAMRSATTGPLLIPQLRIRERCMFTRHCMFTHIAQDRHTHAFLFYQRGQPECGNILPFTLCARTAPVDVRRENH